MTKHKINDINWKCALLAIALLIGLIAPKTTHAQTIIRDTEIENTLKEWTAPLFKAANIDQNGVNIVLVQSPQINAFVSGGANIFIYTGLIQKTKTPEELIGVLAHELGHISGGHLIGLRSASTRASYEAILGTIVGIGAAILTGNGEAATAVIAGTQGIANSRLLSHSRINESAADQAALTFMNASNINPQGLATFFKTLESQELLPASQQNPYVRTHPITRDRIDAIEGKSQKSHAYGRATPPKWVEQHARMNAKLTAFINPDHVPWTYSDTDKSIPATYARAIAAYRKNKTTEALTLIDTLLAQEPKNPYFLELKGQMLLDFGKPEQATKYYKQSVSYLKDSPLIRMAYAHALLESPHNAKNNKQAINDLKRALISEPRSPRIHRLLATAYGRQNNQPAAKLHLAEEATLQRRIPDARTHATFVIQNTPKSSRLHLQAQDLLQYLQQIDKKWKK